MSEAAALELRVMQGMHNGARAPMLGPRHVIGSADSCDFILCDEGVLEQHVELRVQDGVCVLHWLESPAVEPLVLRAELGVHLGTALICVAPLDAPWGPLQDVADVRVSATAAHETTADGSGGDAAPLLGEAVSAGPSVGASAALPAPRKVSHALLLLPLSAILLALALLAPWDRSPHPDAPVEGAVQKPADPGMRVRVEALLTAQGLQGRARVQARRDGTLTVLAHFLSDDEAEGLTEALNREGLRPALKLVGETDYKLNVSEAVARLSAEFEHASVKASYLGQGRFALEGRLADDAQRIALLKSLDTEFPEVKGFDSRINTLPELAQSMLKTLQSERLGQLSGHWEAGALLMKLRLRESERARWEQVLAQAARKFSIPFKAEIQWHEETPEPVVAPGRTVGLPFALRSIVSGPTPYVVLADGNKLMLGGMREGWTLDDISDTQVHFQGPGGSRINIDR